MDTDDLTPMAYDCFRLADDATDVLQSELGAACSEYRREDEYLHGILEDVRKIEGNPEDYLDWGNLSEDYDVPVFLERVRVLRQHIEKTTATPISERG